MIQSIEHQHANCRRWAELLEHYAGHAGPSTCTPATPTDPTSTATGVWR